MSSKDTIFVISDSDALRFASAVVKRVKANEGNITSNGVLAAFSTGLTNGQQNWGGLRQKPLFVSLHIHLASVVSQVSGSSSKAASADQPASEQDLSFSILEDSLVMQRLLRLAAAWGEGKYANYNTKVPVCRFGGQTFYEYELVCIADLVNSKLNEESLKNEGTKYDLMRPWLNSWFKHPPQFPPFLLQRIWLELTREEPMSSGSDLEYLLEGWLICKGCRRPAGSGDSMHIDLLLDLGWIEKS